MPATVAEHGGVSSSVVSIAFRGRSLLSLRRNQVLALDHIHDHELHELDRFQEHVAERLMSLLPAWPPSPDCHSSLDGSVDKSSTPHQHHQQHQILSLPFLQKLLDVLLACEEEFKPLLQLLAGSPALLSKPPLDRAVADLLDRAVKSLDICNAISHALQCLRHWHRHADIAASALRTDHRLPIGLAQLNRSMKSLNKLLAMHSEPRAAAAAGKHRPSAFSRTLSWGLSRNWSAAKQVQAMWTNLAAPRGGADSGCGGGIALAVYTMTSLLVFAMWVLVAAFPCGEKGGPATASPVAPPRQLAWAGPMVWLQERISEEWRRREKKGAPPSPGLLAELQGVERCGRELMEAVRSAAVVLDAELAEAVAGSAAELEEACCRLEEGLGPLERQVRVVFHRVVGNRAEVLRCLDQNLRPPPLSMVL